MSREIHVSGEELWQAIKNEIPADRPAAVVFNSHITGLAVSRSLGKQQVPVIALDRDGRAYGLYSKYVTVAALCPNPLTQEKEFVDLLINIGKRLPQKGVLFPSNDEWVFAVSRHREQLSEYYEFPFSDLETIESILDKKRLYKEAERLGIPIPKTWYPEEWDNLQELADQLPYPCIVKPVEQRSFYEAFGVKVYQIDDKEQLLLMLKKTEEHGVVIQEIIGQRLSDFYSLCSYVGRDRQLKGLFVGRKLEQYPASFGTGCLVTSEYVETIAKDGAEILQTLGYQGISESEFIYDERDEQYKLLDINTRTWKWIGLPIHSGIDLPFLAYQEAVGQEVEAALKQRDQVKWVYMKDYLKLKEEQAGVSPKAHLTDDELTQVVQGSLPAPYLVDAVYDQEDPQPGVRLLKNIYSQGYVCPC
jgi:D-aspartate ligase